MQAGRRQTFERNGIYWNKKFPHPEKLTYNMNDHMRVSCAYLMFEINSWQNVFIRMLKVHKIEIFFGFDFEICIISLLVM